MQQNPMDPMDPMTFMSEVRSKAFREPRSTYQIRGRSRAFYVLKDTCLAKKSSPERVAYCHTAASKQF